MLESFIASFIPIFVAVNVIGILPTYIGITSEVSNITKNSIIIQACATALAVGFIFIVFGKSIFSFLGISIPDFQVAGGILLLLFSIRDLTVGHQERRTIPDAHIGIVPIGMPLIAGPGVLTTVLLMEARYGLFITLSALAVNILIVYLIFRNAGLVLKVIGKPGAIAIGKVVGIFLAAIGVMLIRKGISSFLGVG